MGKTEVRERIEQIGIVPAIRFSRAEDALFAAEAVCAAGIPIVEITMTVPGAIDVIARLGREHPKMTVGAGTIFDLDVARRCVDAGAAFLTSPGFDPALVEFAVREQVLVLAGALTPSEVMLAWKAGSDIVKVFPCSHLGGPAYVKALKAPFPHVPLLASGGVNQQTALDFMLAGSAALESEPS